MLLIVKKIKVEWNLKQRFNLWFTDETMEIYIRKTNRFNLLFLDIGNIEIYHKGKGTFTKLIEEIKLYMCSNIYIESIFNKRLIQYLKRNNWISAKTIPPSYYRT